MKHVLTLSTLFVTGALVAGACSASDGDSDPDTTASEGSGGAGGSGSGGTPSSGGTSAGGTSAGGTSAGGSGGSGGSGGDGAGGSQAGGAAGAGGDDGAAGAAGMDGEGGMAGAPPVECLGDDDVETTPDCDDLPYSAVSCDDFEPPEPFGMTYCKQYAAHATPEAFAEMFDCLEQIDEADQCGEAHDEAVRMCRDGVASLTCANQAVFTRCENFGCLGEDPGEVPLDTCDTYLSSLTPEGQDHVVTCINDHTADEPGGTWGTPPEPPGDGEETCADIFLLCMAGTLQPTEL